MANSNLAQVEEIFHGALSYDREDRAAYLEQVCAGDAIVRREVESLVAAYDSSGGLLGRLMGLVTALATQAGWLYGGTLVAGLIVTGRKAALMRRHRTGGRRPPRY